ncbi:FkbM family methyltransferase [Verrucomicrobia bacterium]|nr:FkbM family methyltransferase [Verrucomicrobiota bacterium]
MKARFLWRALKARYRDESAELAILKRTLKRDHTVCDIGANKGSYLYWLSRWVPNGEVVAFEPQESLAVYLRKICGGLNMSNVEIEAKAVGANSGTKTLYVPGAGDSPGASLSDRVSSREKCREFSVPVVSLDEYFHSSVKIGALKIDVEGAEKTVFEGAARILSSQSPILIFECEERHLGAGSVWDVFEYLLGLGYSGFFVCRKTLCPLEDFELPIHQNQTGERFWDDKDYCANFVFFKNNPGLI